MTAHIVLAGSVEQAGRWLKGLVVPGRLPGGRDQPVAAICARFAPLPAGGAGSRGTPGAARMAQR